MTQQKRCPHCGGDEDQHPWPESGPYLEGCVKELRRRIEALEGALKGNNIRELYRNMGL